MSLNFQDTYENQIPLAADNIPGTPPWSCFDSFGRPPMFGNIIGQQPLFGTQTSSTTDFFKPTSNARALQHQQVITSVTKVNIFHDERDDIIKNWNLLQAYWGTGKAYFSSTQPPVECNAKNPFYQFKAVGYNLLPKYEDNGIINLVINKNVDYVVQDRDKLKMEIAEILGHKSDLIIEILHIAAVENDQTEVKIAVTKIGLIEKNKLIPTHDLLTFFKQPTQQQLLKAAGIISVTHFETPAEAIWKEYAKYRPKGVDIQLWKAAVKDNPDLKKYVPVPINGFTNLKTRMLHFERHTALTKTFLDNCRTALTKLKARHTCASYKIFEFKSKILELQQRNLMILVDQETKRKAGTAIQHEEELLRGRFEVMFLMLNKLKRCFNEILLKNIETVMKDNELSDPNLRLDEEVKEEIINVLKYEQYALEILNKIIEKDLKDLNIIKDGLKKYFPMNRC